MTRLLFRLALPIAALSAAALAHANSSIDVVSRGNGPPAVLLPCLGCPGEVWDPVVELLSKIRTCYVVSIRGFADDLDNDGLRLEDLMAELAGFCQSEKLQDPVLIGHSFGGHLALRIGIAYPDLFSKIIIVDALPYPAGFVSSDITPEQVQQQALGVKQMVLQLDADAFERQQIQILQHSGLDSSMVGQMVQWQVRSAREMVAEGMYDVLSSDLREDIKAIKAKTLVLGTLSTGRIIGLDKAAVMERFAEQYANLPDHTIRITENGGHYLMYDNPAWLLEEIEQFLAERSLHSLE